ncbi:MAG TPA: zinc ribbon domain-containing protein [Dehalococcoidales bacterium]|nr:zinc ribbon domain-containing protein [Dehalococcoidales bacterium]
MPIYEYNCESCNNTFELMRPISKSAEPATCPNCKGKSKRVISKFACFTKTASGATIPMSGTGGCSGCSSSNCSSCGS